MIHQEYGRIPLEKVRIKRFKISGMKDLYDAANMQYRLLLIDGILLAKIDFPKEEGVIAYAPEELKESEVIEAIKPFGAEDLSDEERSYPELLEHTFNLKKVQKPQ